MFSSSWNERFCFGRQTITRHIILIVGQTLAGNQQIRCKVFRTLAKAATDLYLIFSTKCRSLYGRFVIRTSEYDINRGTNFTSEYKVIQSIAGCFVSGASVRCHGKRQTNVPVFLVLRDGLGKDAILSLVKSLDLVCRRLTESSEASQYRGACRLRS